MKQAYSNKPGLTRSSILLAALACCATVSAADATYQYYRFTPTKLRDHAASNSIQIAELSFILDGSPVAMSGVTVTNPKGNTPANEVADRLIDGNAGTKWLDFHRNPVVFDFGTATTVDGYRMITANDAIERDPVRWTMEGSADGITWVLIDSKVADFATPTDRGVTTGDIMLPETPTQTTLAWTGAVSSDWNLTETNWNAGGAWLWDSGLLQVAKFDGSGPKTVTLSEDVTARGIEFAAPGYLIEDETLTLDGVNRLFGSAEGTIDSTIAGTLGITKEGSGTINLTGNNIFTGATVVRGGTLNISGINIYAGNTAVVGDGLLRFTGSTNKAAAGGMTVGDTAGRGTLTIEDNASVVFNGTPRIGAGAGGRGIVKQSGGTATMAQSGQYLTIGDGSQNYGSYELSGGSLATVDAAGFRIGFGGSNGVLTQTGGSLYSGRWFAVAGGNSSGVVNFLGGTASVSGNYRFILGDADGADGVVNIGTQAGGDAVVTGLRTAAGENDGSMVLAGPETATGTLNLNSGTLNLRGRVYKGGGTGSVNLNGGTLQAGAANAELMNDSFTSALIYRDGVTVDTNGFDASMSTSLSDAMGNGLYPENGVFPVVDGGSGYMGAPVVFVDTDGFGEGARATATVENGEITGIVMTCAGQNYEVGDTLYFDVYGGGADEPVSFYEFVLTGADLDSNAAGIFTKTGAGALTVFGDANYTGPTNVEEGTLIANGYFASSTIYVAAGARLAGSLFTDAPVYVAGTFAPGDEISPAIGNSSLELAAGSTFEVQIADWDGTAGLDYDTAEFDSIMIGATPAEKLTIHVDGSDLVGFVEEARDFDIMLTVGSPAPTGLTADNWQVTTANFPGTGSWTLAVTGDTMVLSYEAGTGGYSTWIGGFAGLSDASATGDPDFDGIENIMEYVLNSDPGDASSMNLPVGEVTGGAYVFSYNRRSESKSDTFQMFQYGTDLDEWTDLVIPTSSEGIVTILQNDPSPGFETVTITLPATGERVFGRLLAE